MTLTLSDTLLMGLVLGAFGLVGWRRGVNRELLAVIGIGIAIVIAEPLAVNLRPQVNKLYRLSYFALHGGLGGDNMAAAWEEAKKLPELMPATNSQTLTVIMFLIVSVAFYAVGQFKLGEPHTLMLRLLGMFTGAINGFLVVYYLFPIIFPTPLTVINVPSAEVQTTLSGTQTLAKLVFFFIFVLIALGLYTAMGSRDRQQ